MNPLTKQLGLMLLALLLVIGCVVTGPHLAVLLPPPPPQTKQAVTRSILMAKVGATNTSMPVMILFPPFQYPADVTNYVWSVQFSADLQHWTNQIGGLQSLDGSLGPPLDVPMSGMCGFWRMMGITNRNL